MADNVTWTNERRKLSELVPWEHNPRQIKRAEAERLVESLDTFGQIQTIAVGPNGDIYDGHQRRLCWAASEKFGADYEVDVRVASRELTERERQQLVVFLHRGTVGEWDFDLLSAFDVPDLLDWGFEEWELGMRPTGDDWVAAFAESEPQSLDKVNLTFILPSAELDTVHAGLALFDDDKNNSLILMAKKCLALSSDH